MKKQKILILGASALMGLGYLAGCSQVDISKGHTYNTYLSTSPKTWNTHNWETSDEGYVSGFCEMGLYDCILNDEKNGYILYESQDENNLFRAEMCYWNESDGKHKLIAISIACFTNGRHEPGQYDGLSFLRYNNATKRMADCDAPGFRVRYATDNLDYISYSLPRTGKNITETVWLKNGKTSKRVLKWNGRKFSY